VTEAPAYRLPSRVRRVLTAMAPVVCPPEVEELGLLEAVVDHVELSMGSFPPDLRAALLGALRVMGASSRVLPGGPGRRFEAWWTARTRLRRLAARGVKAMFATAAYEQPAIKERMGYRPEEWIAVTARRRLELYADDIRRRELDVLAPAPLVEPGSRVTTRAAGAFVTGSAWLDEAGTRPLELTCDVVVVGSGAGGAVVAAELAEAGLDVVVVEEGGHHTTEEFTPESTAMVRMLYRDGGAAFARGRPPVQFAEGRCVGGSTTVFGGMSWATPDRVLERWAREDGVDRISAADMAPYFERVERFVSTAPQDPGSVGRDNELLREGAERLGWRVLHNRRAQIHCAGCNTCTYGCPTGAKRSTLVSYLPRAVRFGARVQADCRVDRIAFDDRRRAVGVDGRLTGGGQAFRVRANATFVCCGGIQTPALLERSGVRSPSGRLGRNLSMHPNAKVVAFFDEDVVGFHGAHQGYQVREFENEGIVLAAVNLPPGLLAASLPQYGAEMARTMAEYDHAVTAGVLVEDTSTGRVRAARGGRALTTYDLDRRDAAAIVRGVALLSEAMFAAGARRVMVPFEGFPDLRSADDVARVRDARVDPRAMELFTVHMMGTAAMGADPARHVCDAFGAVRGAEALYVSDASLFPSPVGVNPAETIMALATRNAERFLENA